MHFARLTCTSTQSTFDVSRTRRIPSRSGTCLLVSPSWFRRSANQPIGPKSRRLFGFAPAVCCFAHARNRARTLSIAHGLNIVRRQRRSIKQNQRRIITRRKLSQFSSSTWDLELRCRRRRSCPRSRRCKQNSRRVRNDITKTLSSCISKNKTRTACSSRESTYLLPENIFERALQLNAKR